MSYDTSDYEHEPRILIFDIETSPMLGYTWGNWKQNVLWAEQTSRILCFAYRWHGEEEITVVSQRQFEDYDDGYLNDQKVVEALWDLFDEADIIVAHNGDKFDIRKVQGRMFALGMNRPSPFQTVDTKKVSSRMFMLKSNSLADLCFEIGLGGKTPHTGLDLWRRCMDGDDSAWDLMEEYNIQDVELLTGLYDHMRFSGWITHHPSIALISGRSSGCPTCGEVGQWRKRGFHYTSAYRYQTWQCTHCGSYSRSYASEEGSRSTRRNRI